MADRRSQARRRPDTDTHVMVVDSSLLQRGQVRLDLCEGCFHRVQAEIERAFQPEMRWRVPTASWEEEAVVLFSKPVVWIGLGVLVAGLMLGGILVGILT